MKHVNICEAKTHLSKLLQRVAAGEKITIVKYGVPVARLTPIKALRPKNFLGIDHERLKVPSNFDDPLPADILAGFWAGFWAGKEPKMNKKSPRKSKNRSRK